MGSPVPEGEADPPCGERQAIGGAQRLWRHVRDNDDYLTFDRHTGSWRLAPNRQAFDFDEQTHEMSARWSEHLETRHSWTAADYAAEVSRTDVLIYEAPVDELRAIISPIGPPLAVEHTPEGSDPSLCSHSSVYWPAGMDAKGAVAKRANRLTVREKLADVFTLVHGQITLTPPP